MNLPHGLNRACCAETNHVDLNSQTDVDIDVHAEGKIFYTVLILVGNDEQLAGWFFLFSHIGRVNDGCCVRILLIHLCVAGAYACVFALK